MQTEIISLKDSFDKMIKTKEVDLNVLPMIDKIKKELSDKKTSLMDKGLSNDSSFRIYHSITISNKVLDNISIRLKKAKENKDNPKIAKDTLEIYPDLFALTVNIDQINIKKGKILTSHLLSLASDLQISALKASLFSYKQEIDKNILEEAKEVFKNLKIEGIFNEQEQLQGFN